METTQSTSVTDKVVEALRRAAKEIEQFEVQAALGKAEAQDKYEEVKKKFNLFIHEAKSKVKVGSEKVDDIHQKFDELVVQLALGKAETRDAFREQKKKILLTLHDIEFKIKSNETFKKVYAVVLVEIEKFKVFLESLEKKFDGGKVEAKDSYEKAKVEFNEFIERFKAKYSKQEETRWEHFQGEMTEAFNHLKMAFNKPGE